MERRVALLASGRIARASRQFWDTLGVPEDGTLKREQYERVHRLLTRALAPQMDEASWREAVHEDWASDLRGQSRFTLELYVVSMFEIADLWTESTEEMDYVIFINKLFRRVTRPVRAPLHQSGAQTARARSGGGPGKRGLAAAGECTDEVCASPEALRKRLATDGVKEAEPR